MSRLKGVECEDFDDGEAGVTGVLSMAVEHIWDADV
jgi:hypothetical protein